MFRNCESLGATPGLAAATLAKGCYAEMFKGCKNLKAVLCLAVDTSAENCLQNWLEGVSGAGLFQKKRGASWQSGASGIPAGWQTVDIP